MELTDELIKEKGFHENDEGVLVLGSIKIYKNLVRDGSGNYDGYIVMRPVSFDAKTLEDLEDIVINKGYS